MENDVPHAKKGFMCPMFKKDMSKVCHTCGWWTGLQWRNAKTGEIENKWNCAMVINALGQTDVVRCMAGVQAATESFRNEVVRLGTAAQTYRQVQEGVLLHGRPQALLPGE